MTEQTPDWAALVTDLGDLLDRLTAYSGASGRLGLHDLALYETLRDQPDALSVDPEQAMVRFLDHGEAVFIGGPKGYVWEGYDEDVLSTADQLGLLLICERHGGPWGSDETCPRCTTEDGKARPHDQRGPLTDDEEATR